MLARRRVVGRRTARVASILGVVALLAVALQPIQATATGPSDPDHVNYAAEGSGATASAATWESGYEPAQAIDDSTATAWRATTNDALLVDFDGAKDVFEVHVHLADHAMPEVELYGKQADGSYAPLTSWSGNTATTLVHAVPGGVVAYGIRLSFPSPLTHTHSYNHPHEQCVDMHIHTSPYGEFPHCHEYGTVDHTHSYDEDHPARVAEVEAWGLLPGEADDGLSDGFEEAWWYRQNASAAGLPVAIPNNGTDVLVLPRERPTWAGVDTAAFLDLEVDHTATGDLAVAVGFWGGSAWDDRLVWTPGGFANASLWDTTEVDHVHEDLVCVDMHVHEGPMGEELHCHAYETQQTTHVHAYPAAAAPAGTGTTLALATVTSSTDSASSASGSVSHVTVDLRAATLQTWEADAGFRTPQFGTADLQDHAAWRVLVRDVDPYGGTGSVLSAALVTEERSSTAEADTDGDGLLDGDDLALGAFPVAADTDWDGLGDFHEKDPWALTLTVDGSTSTVTVTTFPSVWDSDGDGLSDGEEAELGFDGAVTNPAVGDTDGDSLGDGDEALVHRSNATRTDTDGDGFDDDVEVTSRSLSLTVNGTAESRTITTLPYAEDSDGDGLSDGEEWYGTSVSGVVTDPSDPDTDGDGLPDGSERVTREAALPFRRTVGSSTTVNLSAVLSGPLERAEVRYGLSSVDVSHFYVRLDKGAASVVLRDHEGSGLYNYSSVDVTDAFPHGGDYALYVSSDVAGGVLEEFALAFTLRTSPVDADSDGDGLNDSEEASHGADGWVTDPNAADSDGDGWNDGYETTTSGTSPLAADTDGDGATDPDDLNPLRNLLVRVKVKQAHHGGAWWDPELAVIVRVNDDYTWVSKHETGSADGSDDHTASFYYSYHADVPDDVSTVSVRASAWSFNDLRGDDLIEDGTVSYTLNSGLQSYTISGGESWITLEVSTVALQKTRTILITDGNVTVEAASGQTRMAAPDRFVVLTLNVTSATSPFVVGVNTVLVPRALFLESKLWADFESDAYAPLATADFYGEDLGEANVSEDVAGLIAGTLAGAEASDVLDRLLRNSTDVEVFAHVDITSQAVLANLPYDIVRILPWTPVTNGPTGAVPQGFWDKINAGATQAVNVLLVAGQLVLEGVVALGTFLVDLAQAVWDWGMQAAGAVQAAAQVAVEKVGEVLASLLKWAWDFMVSLAQVAISVVVGAAMDYVDSVEEALNTFLGRLAYFDNVRTDETIQDTLLAGVEFALSFFGLRSLVRPLMDALQVVQRLTQSLSSVLNPFFAVQALAAAVGGDIGSSVSGLFASVESGISQGLGWLLSLDIGSGGLLDTLGVYSITPVDTSTYSSLSLETFVSFAKASGMYNGPAKLLLDAAAAALEGISLPGWIIFGLLVAFGSTALSLTLIFSGAPPTIWGKMAVAAGGIGLALTLISRFAGNMLLSFISMLISHFNGYLGMAGHAIPPFSPADVILFVVGLLEAFVSPIALVVG